MTDREFSDELKQYNDRICNSIFHLDVEWVDIEIQISEMRYFCEEHAPQKLALFEMVYASRFRRLWESWAKQNEPREWEQDEQRLPGWEQNITQW
jgi:hypothetical protein